MQLQQTPLVDPASVRGAMPLSVVDQPGLSSQQDSAGSRGYLSFRLGREEYGIDILKVQEIRSYAEPTRMAGAPAFIRGVINLRGDIVPVVDLRLRFGLAEARQDGSTVVIVLNVARRVIGIVVDAVSEVIELHAGQLRPAPAFAANLDTDFIEGLAAIPADGGERLLIVTDIERLMLSPSMGLAAA